MSDLIFVISGFQSFSEQEKFQQKNAEEENAEKKIREAQAEINRFKNQNRITLAEKKLEQDKKIYEIPDQPGMKCSVIRQHIDDPDLHKIIDFYLLLRQMNRAEFARAREFRRHVTMTLVIQGEKVEVNIDNITEFYKQTKDHLAYMRKLTIGT